MNRSATKSEPPLHTLIRIGQLKYVYIVQNQYTILKQKKGCIMLTPVIDLKPFVLPSKIETL